MITTNIVFFISLWIHGCMSNTIKECTKENPFYMIDMECANFNDVCVKKDYGPCKSLLQACAQCPASNLTESALVNMLTILRDQRNTTTSYFAAGLNNFSLEIKSQMNQQNKTTDANYKKFEARLNKSEREILEKLVLVEKISSSSTSMVIFITVICVINFLVILLVLMKMRWQTFKLCRRITRASRNNESMHLITNPRFDETNNQTLADIQNQIQTILKTLSGAAAPSEQKNGVSSINNSSKFYILETNVPKLIDFDIESLRIIEMCTREITIKSIFDNNEEVFLSYSIVESVGNINKKIADWLECPAENVILFCGNKILKEDVFLFRIDIKQLKFCYLKPFRSNSDIIKFATGDYSTVCTYKDLSKELVLKKYARGHMKIMKENEAILNELETFQITKSHKGFVRLNGIFTDENYLYVSMEKMEGSIKDNIANKHPLTEEIIAKWAKQILSALKYLHDRGIIHRNIKPSSILLDKDENIKLPSFGFNKYAVWGDKQYLKPDHLSFQPEASRYIDPEIRNNENYGVHGDVWSFGATMMEIATGKQPCYSMTTWKALINILDSKRIPFELDKSYSSKLKDFIDKCLIADPKDRATVDELLNHNFLIPK